MGMDTTEMTEPVPAAMPAAEAGSNSSHAAPTRTADALRAITCAVLVAGCVSAPDSAPILAPFIPALVAIRVLRRGSAAAFLGLATMLAIGSALVTSQPWPWTIASVATAVLLVPGLGLAHARAARRDPISSVDQPEWPEPRLDTGFSLAIVAWMVALALLTALIVPTLDSPRATGHRVVRDGYAGYLDECHSGKALDNAKDLCDSLRQQRDDAYDLVDDHGAELLGLLLAIFAFGAAGTAHPVTMARARRTGASIRPRWRLRELEVHWSAAYLLAAGLVAYMLSTHVDGAVGAAARGTAAGAASLGALLVLAQGVGFVSWLLTRGRTPGWYRVFLLVSALLALPITFTVLFGLGVLDMAWHPRRRARASGSLPGRGSGS
jgi:hypothetical protein